MHLYRFQGPRLLRPRAIQGLRWLSDIIAISVILPVHLSLKLYPLDFLLFRRERWVRRHWWLRPETLPRVPLFVLRANPELYGQFPLLFRGRNITHEAVRLEPQLLG